MTKASLHYSEGDFLKRGLLLEILGALRYSLIWGQAYFVNILVYKCW